MITIGDNVPDMALRTDEGTPLGLRDLNGRALVLFLLGEPLSSGASSLLEAIAENVQGFLSMGVSPVVAIGDSVKNLADYRAQHDAPFLFLSDEQLTLNHKFRKGAENPAIAYIIDSKGVVVDVIPSLPSSELVNFSLNRASKTIAKNR